MLKDLYKLKQSAWLWFDLLGKKLRDIDFIRSNYDHAFYLNGNGMFIPVYVDDVQLIDRIYLWLRK